MPGIIVNVVADVSQFVKGMQTSTKAANVFSTELKTVSVDAKTAAQAQIAAAIKTTDALHAEVAAYREIAAAAEVGSKEQITAARLAASAQTRLDASLVGTSRSTRRAHGESEHLGRSLEHGARGALSGSHAFEGLGRSLAFASGGFIALEGASSFLRESINAAREAAVAQRSLAAQMAASGESFDQNRERIEKVALSYGKFGFQNDAVVQSLTVLERGTGSINKAISLQGLTADLARAKNLELANAATVVAKVFGGQETALRRAVPGLEKNAHGWDLIRQAQAKLAGQAAANTTASERFAATLHDTEEIIGTALLPTLNKYLTSLGRWLDRMNRSGQLQRDVASAAKTLTGAVDAAKAAVDVFVGVFKGLNAVTGSTKQTLKLLFSAFLAFKTVKLAATFADLATSLRGVGTAAETSTGKVRGLRGALRSLPELVAITASVDIIMNAHTTDTGLHRYSGSKGWGNLLHDLAHPERLWQNITGGSGSNRPKPVVVKPFPDIGFRGADLSDPTRDVKRFQATAAEKTARRNAWFDAIINRQLDRVQDIPGLKAQNARLREIAGEIQKRYAATNDITRQLTLEDQLAQVFRTIRGNQQQLAADAKQAADAAKQAAKDRADAAKQAAEAARQEQVAWADVAIQKAQSTVSLQDDLKADRAKLALLQAQAAIGHMTAEKAVEILAVQQDIKEKTQQVAINAKSQNVKRLQTKIDWAVFNLEKDDATKTLKDNIRDEKIIIGLIKEHIRLVGKNLSDARELWQRQQELKGFLGQKKKPKLASDEAWKLGVWQRIVGKNGGITGGGSVPSVPSFAPTAVIQPAQPFAAQGVTITNLNLYGVQNVRQLNDELVKQTSTRPQPRRGP